MTTALFAGRFDPVTNGHLDIARRSAALFESNQDALDGLRSLVEGGKLTLRVAEILPLERVGEAHHRLAAGGVRGRLVIAFF